jgi:hypothetical protein
MAWFLITEVVLHGTYATFPKQDLRCMGSMQFLRKKICAVWEACSFYETRSALYGK